MPYGFPHYEMKGSSPYGSCTSRMAVHPPPVIAIVLAILTKDVVFSLLLGGLLALILTFLMFVPRKLMTFGRFMEGVTEGMKNMVPSCAILIPIVIPVATALSPILLIVALSATLSGSVFGDHCSPISDTTILSSTGARCDHMVHVSTQLPYALCSAGCAALGYIAAGLTDGNLAATWSISFASLLLLLTKTNNRT